MVLGTHWLRFGPSSVEGLFDGADIAAFETGDIRVEVRLSRNSEIMTAALLALCGRAENGDALSPARLSPVTPNLARLHSG